MKGLFIPGITAEMFMNGSLESIEDLAAMGHLFDVECRGNKDIAWLDKNDCAELNREFIRMASYVDTLLTCLEEQRDNINRIISRIEEYMPWKEVDQG